MAKHEPSQHRGSARRAAIAWTLTVGLLLTGFFSAFGHAGHDMRSPAARAAALIGFGGSAVETVLPDPTLLEQPLCQTSQPDGHAQRGIAGEGHKDTHSSHPASHAVHDQGLHASGGTASPTSPDSPAQERDFARPCPGGVCTISPVALQAPVAVELPSAAASAIAVALPQDVAPPVFATPGQNAGPRAPPAR